MGASSLERAKCKDNRPRKTLEQRIMSSSCRICHQQGHWKAECPLRNQANVSSTEATAAAPTSTVITTASGDPLPLEFLDLPEASIDEPKPEFCESFVCESTTVQGKYSFRGRILGEPRKVNYTMNIGLIGATPKERLRSHLLRNDERRSVQHRSQRCTERHTWT